jgi:Dirigent-like protein
MRRALTTVLVAGVGVLTLTGATVATAETDGDRSRRGDRTLEFDVRFSDFFLLDFGPTGVREVTSFQDPQLSPSKGDQTVFEDVLLRGGEEVGAASGSCVITELRPTDFSLQCDITYELESGQIAVQGRTTGAPVKTLSIVGGTGRYVGASGELTLTEFGDGTGSVVFRLSRR